MSVTLKQIADMAGVHKSTVDKVIHDRPGVSEAKREQIRALLEQYGYESTPLAKARNYEKKKLTVGILLAHTAASAALRHGIERVRQDFASFNIALDLRETEAADTEQQAACLREFRESGAAGVIACTADDEAVKTALCALHDADILVTVSGFLLGGQFGIGTVISALGLGSLITLNFSLLHFRPAKVHQENIAETLRYLRS